MALTVTLAACSTNETLNGPAGTDPPSSLDDQIRYALRFIAELRDGASFPVGMIVPFPTTTAPSGWIKCNGASLSRATYAALWAFGSANSTTESIWNGSNYQGMFSQGDGSTTFRVPDLRGMFLRGLDESRGVDAARPFGSFQDQANLSHNHGVTDPTHAHAVYDPGHSHGASAATDGTHQHAYLATAASSGAGATAGGTTVYALSAGATDPAGAHTHAIGVNTGVTNIAIYAAATGITTQFSGGTDNRPKNYPFPFYIKY